MPHAAASIPFDKARRLPSNWAIAKAVLTSFKALVSAPYTAAEREAVANGIRDAGDDGGLRAGGLDRFVVFWNAELDKLPPTSPGALTADRLLALNLHPLVPCAVLGGDDLAQARGTWFNDKGGSRLVRGTGGDDPESDGGALSGNDGDGDEREGDPDERERSLTLGQLGNRRQGLAPGQALGGQAVVGGGNGAGGGAGARAAAELDRRNEAGRAEADRDDAGDELGGEDEEEDDEVDDAEGIDLPVPETVGGEAFLAAVKNALATAPPAAYARPVPRYQREYLDAVRLRSILYHQKSHRDRQPLLDAWRSISQVLVLSFEDVRRIALNEHISLAELRDSRPGKAANVDETTAAVYNLQQIARAKKPAPLDPYDWGRQFDRWASILALVNTGGAYETRRKRAVARYRAFIDLQFTRCGDASDPDAARRLIVNYDEAVRAELCRPADEAYVRSFDDCDGNDTLYRRLVDNALTASASRVRSPRAADTRPLQSTVACRNYNRKADHVVATPPSSSSAERTTSLSARGSSWGWAEAAGAAAAVAALGAGAGELRMEAQDPWAASEASSSGLVVAHDLRDAEAPANPLPGIGPAPRLLRGFHWPEPEAAPPLTPSLDASLHAPPLPRPPPSVSSYPPLVALLRRRAELFSAATPLRPAAFAAALADHPNQPWVASLVESLRDGFWPAHSGAAPTVPRPARRDSLFPSRREDQDAQVAAARDAVERGFISAPFDELEDGMVVSPQFAVRRDGSEPRMVDDHSASGLNDGVGEAPATYDRVDLLVRLLRYAGLVANELPPETTLWKLDVSSAFKLLPMSPFWQARQVMVVAYRDSAGRLAPRFHVQHRAAFGSRASPYLWTSVMSGVMWVVQKRSVAFVPHPLFYMDDAYNPDFSGQTEVVVHSGEAREVPAGQAATIRVWDELGVDWKWKKAEHGRRLTITGLVVDLDERTITLPPDAVERFATSVSNFLDRSKGRQRPLRAWRQITGWANWALTVRPWSRPLLSPLFQKLGRAHSAYAEVFVNQEVRFALETFVAELRTGEPLSMVDPALTDWRPSDADLTIFTDACLETTAKDGSGLGFWYDEPGGGGTRRFASRPLVRYSNIGYAESLAVASAILHALKQPSRVERLLVRTDSATAAYAFDGGGSRREDIAELVKTVYAALRERRVDLRVSHIRGTQNVTADRLSRDPGAPQMSAPVGARKVTFAPRASDPRVKPKKEPYPPLASLRARRRLLWEAAIASSTSYAYERAYHAWAAFSLAYRFPSFPSADTLSLFVTLRSERVVPTTLAADLSGIAFYFKAIDPERWSAARASPEVLRALTGNAKLNPHTVTKARPLPVEALVRAVEVSLARRTYEGLLWAAMAVVCFFAAARAQELTAYDNPMFDNSNRTVLRSTVRLTARGFAADLPYHKADPLYTGSKLWFAAVDAGSLLDVVRAYLLARDALFDDSGPLWLLTTGGCPPRKWFVERAQARCGAEFTGHSFRAGAATWYALRGAPDEQIKKLGRWKGDGWADYVRLQPEIAQAQRERDAGGVAAHLPPPSLSADALGALAF
ncbi:hypothetical protein JCM5296_006730 [Sporobolomyces johnsonii]